ncbi:hypothetical protein A3C98_04390 [Candidatus Roizmanbacteria bacterium RIFCSPHIGHO2_02_FULL_37_15]|uniref:EamA domain-containing protein n=1 Tax=Candidatus Roizmanbacteria bacterium RIFCSPLOWO2_01_FULL_37_16 TaxID=1802058 RepID=A0A1F7IIR9_9BACT|nr:MAG: hypothetical protein A2859_01020 [Candidatus Roizmanbacteria bacterium RIFCSPHIGHO2_01_FULL_37_16b]OGK20731.1 MAG: hypothetical protein A3C98_04390 [Candidatus Roizmanbacteria bacterium RIFCSPHIGHO2_02_FULL_37_15]OGK33322.1 MAG: hypothetical protein A3F57_05270 [Candidatus Roizmanbacteria bacterium RIFCSPHIGHO2_12_FULL_36_11]OGK43214.1 MAG: hypothetical protein A3B40_03045 [Candidatus Roizmanbacteria bacterium RIFCSPLOWO2_01_FULL_37_16]OGK57636.1 MAG: hypothetical protein A3I50_00750 [C
MSWFSYAILATFCFTSYDLISRILSLKSINPRVFSVIFCTLVSLFAIVLFFFAPTYPEKMNRFIFILGIVGLLIWAIFGRLEYYVHKMVEASTLTIVIRLAYVITFLGSLILLNEHITLKKILAVIVIFIANILIIKPTGRKKLDTGIFYALLLAFFLGIGWMIDKIVSNHWGVSFYVILSFLSPAVLNALIPPIKKKEFISEIRNTSWHIILLALLNTLGYYFLLKAFALGEASRVILVTSMAQIMTIVLGIWLLKERDNALRKILAGLLAFGGILLLR